MHRQTPLTSGFVGYSSGGARALIHEIDDSTMMQQMKGSMMGESRSGVESPQNYGFTSVVMPATKTGNGEIDECAEGFMSYFGGNRTSNFCAVMDDRRYRLKELEKGDVAMFDHLQHQIHLNDQGVFVTGRTDKKMKFQLGDPPQDQQSGQSSGGNASGGGSGGQSGGRKMTGQKKRYDKDSGKYLEMTNDTHNLVHDQNINYKSGTHQFQPPSSASAASRAGGPLVQIFGDKFTAGLGHFMKQVTAAPPTSPMHLTTKGYVNSIFAALGITIPTLPSLPMPPLPPGVTLPPGITLPTEALAAEPPKPGPPVPGLLEARLQAMERRIAELESRAA